MDERQELIALLKQLDYHHKYNKLESYYFTDQGDDDHNKPGGSWSRRYFVKHLEFFAAGAKYRQRWASCGNRTSKTVSAMYEMVLHASGRYPHWWEGRRVTAPEQYLVIGQTIKSTRDVIQKLLLGDDPADMGTGIIPRDALDFDTLKSAKKTDTTIDSIRVKNVNGGYSTILLRSCEMNSLALAGLNCHVFFDEPPPLSIFQEAVLRSMVGNKMVVISATPVNGFSDTLEAFLGSNEWKTGEISPDKCVLTWNWYDVPFLQQRDIDAMLALIPPHARKVRMEGIPYFESGLVYPVDMEAVVIPPFQIPAHFKYLGGLDVGFKNTAGLVLRYDEENDVVYVTQDMLFQEKPLIEWAPVISHNHKHPWIIDSAANQASQATGESIRDQLTNYGLVTHNPGLNKSVDAGIYIVLDRFISGKLKIFSTCAYVVAELKRYTRDEKGKVIKAHDHHMDAMRYAVTTLEHARTDQPVQQRHFHAGPRAW